MNGHEVGFTQIRSETNTVYFRAVCSCGHHDSIHLTRIDAGKAGADHVRVVEQLSEQASTR